MTDPRERAKIDKHFGFKDVDKGGLAKLIEDSKETGLKWKFFKTLNQQFCDIAKAAGLGAILGSLSKSTNLPIAHLEQFLNRKLTVDNVLSMQYPESVRGEEIVEYGFDTAFAKLYSYDMGFKVESLLEGKAYRVNFFVGFFHADLRFDETTKRLSMYDNFGSDDCCYERLEGGHYTTKSVVQAFNRETDKIQQLFENLTPTRQEAEQQLL